MHIEVWWYHIIFIYQYTAKYFCILLKHYERQYLHFIYNGLQISESQISRRYSFMTIFLNLWKDFYALFCLFSFIPNTGRSVFITKLLQPEGKNKWYPSEHNWKMPCNRVYIFITCRTLMRILNKPSYFPNHFQITDSFDQKG